MKRLESMRRIKSVEFRCPAHADAGGPARTAQWQREREARVQALAEYHQAEMLRQGQKAANETFGICPGCGDVPTLRRSGFCFACERRFLADLDRKETAP